MTAAAQGDHPDAVLSVVVPVYRNESTLGELIQRLERLQDALSVRIEVVFVVDGSPDRSESLLGELLAGTRFSAQLLGLARNFGSFAAIRMGLEAARGRYMAVLAADLQEPPELIEEFYAQLATGEVDVVVGTRRSRSGDSAFVRITSTVFWNAYRRIVNREIPAGGVDVFACTANVRDALLRLDEARSSQIGLLYWVGFRRAEVAYDRRPRADGGRSGWTFRRRVRYMADSAFAFSDLPIRALLWVGGIASLVLLTFAAIALVGRLLGLVTVRGYAALVLLNASGFAAVLFALGLVGSYTWRAYENTKQRPIAIVARHVTFDAREDGPRAAGGSGS